MKKNISFYERAERIEKVRFLKFAGLLRIPEFFSAPLRLSGIKDFFEGFQQWTRMRLVL